MQTHVEPGEIALRLLLTVVAGTLIGVNRGEHGRAAGLRTTLLVCLAASVSMIQLNLLLPIRGKASDSYVVMDLMRLPLGILSGMGFIGGGAILRKDSMVLGVTTAATLWFVTVIGLCMGGGQIVVGSIATALGLAILWLLKPIEESWKQDRQATLTIVSGNGGPGELAIASSIAAAGYKVSNLSVEHTPRTALREVRCVVHWRSRQDEIQLPPFVHDFANQPQILKVAWQP